MVGEEVAAASETSSRRFVLRNSYRRRGEASRGGIARPEASRVTRVEASVLGPIELAWSECRAEREIGIRGFGELKRQGPTDQEGRMTVLMRVEDHRPFAYSHDDREFRRVGDGSAWAREVDGYLVSVRSGRLLAMQVGNFFLDAETLSVLYFAPSEARRAQV